MEHSDLLENLNLAYVLQECRGANVGWGALVGQWNDPALLMLPARRVVLCRVRGCCLGQG